MKGKINFGRIRTQTVKTHEIPLSTPPSMLTFYIPLLLKGAKHREDKQKHTRGMKPVD